MTVPCQKIVASHSVSRVAELVAEAAEGFVVSEVLDEFLLDVLTENMALIIDPQLV